MIGWTALHDRVHGAQLFFAGRHTEAERQVIEERFRLSVVCPTSGPDGSKGCGTGEATLLADEPVEPAIARAVEMARHVHNPLHGLSAPAPLPDIPLEESDLVERPAERLRQAHADLTSLAGRQPRLRLTAAEWHAQTIDSHIVNSRGQEGSQRATTFGLEWVLVTGEGDERVESFHERNLRRSADLPMEEEFETLVQRTFDRRRAASAPEWDGPVVVRDLTLADFLDGGPLRFLGSASNRYAKLSRWDIGQSVVPEGASGDPLTVWANRVLPYGTRSCRFDAEGIPGQRLLLIQDNLLQALSASQRYAEYLNLPPTGDFGNLELPAGATPVSQLLSPPYLEVAGFSLFYPDAVTGDFATEIRLGYMVEDGLRKPFRGGLLIGNLLAALGRARWSRETGFFSDYQGPTTGRFEGLKVAGPTAG